MQLNVVFNRYALLVFPNSKSPLGRGTIGCGVMHQRALPFSIKRWRASSRGKSDFASVDHSDRCCSVSLARGDSSTRFVTQDEGVCDVLKTQGGLRRPLSIGTSIGARKGRSHTHAHTKQGLAVLVTPTSRDSPCSLLHPRTRAQKFFYIISYLISSTHSSP